LGHSSEDSAIKKTNHNFNLNNTATRSSTDLEQLISRSSELLKQIEEESCNDDTFQIRRPEMNSLNKLNKRDLLQMNELNLIGRLFIYLKSILDKLTDSSSTFVDMFENRTVSKYQKGTYKVLIFQEIFLILEEYENKVKQQETLYLQNEPINLNRLISSFSSDKLILKELLDLILKLVKKESLHGGPLLDLLYIKTVSGKPSLKEIFQRIFKRTYSGFYSTLSKWLLCGKIDDPFNEFFIKDTRKKVIESIPNQTSVILRVSTSRTIK
jgi:hypothetical protein